LVNVFHMSARWWCPRSFNGICDTIVCPKMTLCSVTRSVVTCSSSWHEACRWWSDGFSAVIISSFFFLLFSPFQLKYVHVPFFLFVFQFQSLYFYCLFSFLILLEKFFIFSIQSLNYNFSYIIFTNSIFILLICHLYPWMFS